MEEIVLSDQRKLKELKINEFERGLLPDDTKIGQYSKTPLGQDYAVYKNRVNPLAGFGYVDLMLTGSFTNRLFLKSYGNRLFEFGSTDNKTGNLLGKYGNEIMGLNKETFEERQKNVYRITLSYEIQKILNKI